MITVILIITLTLVITVNYSVLMMRITHGVKKLSHQYKDPEKNIMSDQEYNPSIITVLVAARNEEQSVRQCLESLINQNYPKDKYEIIIIDDQSTDATAALVNNAITSNPGLIRLLYTTASGGKKNAIRIGLNEAKGEIILTTDADCLVPITWISEYNKAFRNSGAAFISAPVMMNTDGRFFNNFQALEFNSLIASTAGLTAIGKPVMSNGANMGFTFQAYREVQSSISASPDSKNTDDIMQKDKASGEDVFTMLSIKKYLGSDKISFIYSGSAIVKTKTQQSVNDFMKQRVRWVSKSSGYKDFDAIYTALSVFCMNLLLFVLPFILILKAFSNNESGYYYLILSFFVSSIFKALVDYRLLYIYTRDIGQKHIIHLLPLMEPLVIIYTSVTGLLGNFLSFEWKGRKHKR